ncbi:MAG TPA: UDP-glucose 4-epimerase GalE [Candidatus Polarisedimenticolia bacterium]|nr:UDP-glucose 4-epimerase GalE [Candidatus Polarisedimenticolia bacterium]
MRILVTGGAGYVGSHVAAALAAAGHGVVVLDDLSEGHRGALEGFGASLVVGDIADPAVLDACLEQGPVDGVVHMAASCLVGESMERPSRYFDNNVERSLRLLDHLAGRGVKRVVFSSTAAVYGEPDPRRGQGLDEDHPCEPTNVYGESKLMVERALDWLCRRAGFGAVALRYFNAAGADPRSAMGEDHDPETHLVPLVCRAALDGSPVTILGRDYPTPDGTCLRDYVHVADLASAHLLALEALRRGASEGRLAVYNLGAQQAVSVLEVVEAARRITARPIAVRDGPRRAGDPAVLRASSTRIRRELGWKPAMSDLESILRTAWRWHAARPRGFDGPPPP